MKSKFVLLLLTMISPLLLTSCGNDTGILSEKVTQGISKLKTSTDYSKTENWLSLPSESSKDVDVIYFYPTAYSKGGGDDVICDIDSKSMHQIAPRQLKAQASVFSTSCNIYAPYYRQVDANYALTVSNEDNEKLFRYLASTNPTTALNYYFEHLNQGRPYVLAGHSQGSQSKP